MVTNKQKKTGSSSSIQSVGNTIAMSQNALLEIISHLSDHHVNSNVLISNVFCKTLMEIIGTLEEYWNKKQNHQNVSYKYLQEKI